MRSFHLAGLGSACVAVAASMAVARPVSVDSSGNVQALIDAKADGVTVRTATLAPAVVNAASGSSRNTSISNNGSTHEDATEVTPPRRLDWFGTSSATASVDSLRAGRMKLTVKAIAELTPTRAALSTPSGTFLHLNPMVATADAVASASFQDRVTLISNAVPPGTTTVRVELAISEIAYPGDSRNPNGEGNSSTDFHNTASLSGTSLTVTNDGTFGGSIRTAFADLPLNSSFDFLGSTSAAAHAFAGHAGQVISSLVSDAWIRLRVVTPGVSLSFESGLDLSTHPGDADYDGSVNFNDLIRIAKNYGTGTTWQQGDFNDDGTVGFPDLVAIAQNYSKVFDPITASSFDAAFAADWALAQSLVPEPATVGTLALTAGMLRRRR